MDVLRVAGGDGWAVPRRLESDSEWGEVTLVFTEGGLWECGVEIRGRMGFGQVVVRPWRRGVFRRVPTP
ncbi:hypothetical protein [Streptomyces cylindrosporus]|uniref:Uncharacterized protein n=1 Tax=Streptomyces cylindrosporus TaxID=2927583 RepID=A0ABS9YQ47_9ACTN|nr:hypothetical protein [Streptomyces cylindrosporus]MCI3278726.1 hypothetical protein [Streptomyces cylindrosporus]